MAITVLLVGLVAGLWFFMYKDNNQNNQSGATSENSNKQSDDINYSPATEQEKKAADKIKDLQSKEEANNPQEETSESNQNSSSKKTVTPVITNVSAESVSGYINGVFEEGGKCSAVFVKGSSKRTLTSTGFTNVSYTQCAPIEIPSNYLSSGTWKVTLKYESNKATGSSAPEQLEI